MEETFACYQGIEGEYDTFIRVPEEIPEGKVIDLMVREIPRFRSRAVRAKVYKGWDEGRSGDKLYPLTPLGRLHSGSPWTIEIIEKLEDEVMGENRVQRCIYRK